MLRILKIFLLSLVSISLVAACSDNSSDQAQKKDIVIGTTPGDFADMVTEFIKPELAKEGYNVQLIEFSDYVRPNLALNEGSLDLNVFQHKPYLDDFKAEHNLDIVEFFQVPTGPLGLYPGKRNNLNDLSGEITVSLPDDVTNQARAIVLLKELGWIELKPNVDELKVGLNDIAKYNKNVKLIPLVAAQIPRARQDVDFAAINGNYAVSAGIPFTDALFIEEGFTFVNWSAIKTKDEDTDWAKAVKRAYESEAFKGYAKERFKGYKYPKGW